MTLQEELTLSYYQRVSPLVEDHNIWLVRHTQSGRLAVEKHPSIYHQEVYQSLMTSPVPHTPRIYAAIEDNGAFTVIEEYISGTPLSMILKNGTLTELQAVDIVQQLCKIVASLHACTPPIIHRDIKPANILVADDGVVTLLDFDAAKPFDDEADRDTRLIGTTGYAAPEQYGFAASGPHADQYAIGVLMAELVYGSYTRTKLTNQPYDRIIRRCTRMDPADRYAAITDIISELSLLHQTSDHTSDAPTRERFLSWLPPGFRSLHPARMLLMTLWYAMIFWIALTLEVENADPFTLAVNRGCALAALLLITFFLGNYRNIWKRLRIERIRHPLVRMLVLAAASFFIFVTAVIIALIVVALFH